MSWLDRSVNENKGVEFTDGIDNKDKSQTNIYSKLTYKKLEELITDLTFNSDTISIGQHCKTNGFIIRNAQDLKICDDSECKSCQEMAKSMKEAGKKYYKDGED